MFRRTGGLAIGADEFARRRRRGSGWMQHMDIEQKLANPQDAKR
jgi:hypothetical protein